MKKFDESVSLLDHTRVCSNAHLYNNVQYSPPLTSTEKSTNSLPTNLINEQLRFSPMKETSIHSGVTISHQFMTDNIKTSDKDISGVVLPTVANHIDRPDSPFEEQSFNNHNSYPNNPPNTNCSDTNTPCSTNSICNGSIPPNVPSILNSSSPSHLSSFGLNGSSCISPPVDAPIRKDLSKLDETIDYVLAAAVSDEPHEDMFFLSCRAREPNHLCPPTPRPNTPSSGMPYSPASSPTSSPNHFGKNSTSLKSSNKSYNVVQPNSLPTFLTSSSLNRPGLLHLASQNNQRSVGKGIPVLHLFPDPNSSIKTTSDKLQFAVRHPINQSSPHMLLQPTFMHQCNDTELGSTHATFSSNISNQDLSLKMNPNNNLPLHLDNSSETRYQMQNRSIVLGANMKMPGFAVSSSMDLIPNPNSSPATPRKTDFLSNSSVSNIDYRRPVSQSSLLSTNSSPFSKLDNSSSSGSGLSLYQQSQPNSVARKRPNSSTISKAKRRKTSPSSGNLTPHQVVDRMLQAQQDPPPVDAGLIEHINNKLAVDLKSLLSAPSLTSFSSDMLTNKLFAPSTPHIDSGHEIEFLSIKGSKYQRSGFTVQLNRKCINESKDSVVQYILENLSLSLPPNIVTNRYASVKNNIGSNYPVADSPQPVSFDNEMQTLLTALRHSDTPGDEVPASPVVPNDDEMVSVNKFPHQLIPAFSNHSVERTKSDSGRVTPPLLMYHMPNPQLICQSIHLPRKIPSSVTQTTLSSNSTHAGCSKTDTSLNCITNDQFKKEDTHSHRSSHRIAGSTMVSEKFVDCSSQPITPCTQPGVVHTESISSEGARHHEEATTLSSLTLSTQQLCKRQTCLFCRRSAASCQKSNDDLIKSTGLNIKIDPCQLLPLCSEECFSKLTLYLSRGRPVPSSLQTVQDNGSVVNSESRPCSLVSELASSLPVLVQSRTHKGFSRRMNSSNANSKRRCVATTRYKFGDTHWRSFSSDVLSILDGRRPEQTGETIRHEFAPLSARSQDDRVCLLCRQTGDCHDEGPGRLLPIDIGQWIHVNCSLWCYDTYETVGGAISESEKSLKRALATNCTRCGQSGAALPCYNPRCTSVYHVPCALTSSCLFTDRGMYCTQHHPKDGNPIQLVPMTVNRRVFVSRDENQLVGGVVQTNPSQHDLRIGSVSVHCIGQILPRQLESGRFHNRRHIYPVGFSSTRYFWSCRLPNRRSRYSCSISESPDGSPLFKVVASDREHDDDLIFVESTCDSVWQKILTQIDTMRSEFNLVHLFPQHLTGEYLYGLTESHVVRSIESLPGVAFLRDYIFSFGRMELISNMPLAVNPTGCARSEPMLRPSFTRRDLDGDVCSALNISHKVFPGLRLTRQPGLSFHHSELSTTASENVPKKMYSIQQLNQTRCESIINVYLGRSRIQGLGLFAARAFEPQSWIAEYVGELIRVEMANKREKMYTSQQRGIYMFRLDDDTVIDATMRGGMARYINHSCQPNCVAEFVSIGDHSHIMIIANRRIERGEELCYDYNFSDEPGGEKIPCLCRSLNCRKWLT